MTPIELGALLDGWTDEGRVRLVETAAALTISRLTADTVRELAVAAEGLGWPLQLHDAAGEATDVVGLDDELGPFVGTLNKPAEGADRRVLTTVGFAQALAEVTEGVWQVACIRTPFVSGTASFNPWGQADVFAPSSETKSPLELVREASEIRSVPTDARKWLLRGSISEGVWRDRGFQVFAQASFRPLVCSLASEVLGQTSVIFAGPPRLNMAIDDAELAQGLQLSGYRRLQAAVAWVYEDRSTAEQRHALFAAEFARSITRSEQLGAAIRSAGHDILEGARLAFQLSQSDLSREAIKAQGDLRKAIADDTSKAAESARTLAGAIAVAIATGITLVAARSTSTTEPWVLSLVAGVVAVYLLVVAGTGWSHLALQSQLRGQWRARFYRFVPADDYKAMVTDPARAAELPYHLIGAVSVIVSLVLAGLAVAEWQRPPAPAPVTTTIEAAVARPPAVPPAAPGTPPVENGSPSVETTKQPAAH